MKEFIKDYIQACSETNNRIDVLTRDGLNPLKILLYLIRPSKILNNNNTLYVTSTLGRIMVLKDEVFNSDIQAVCSSIRLQLINLKKLQFCVVLMFLFIQ